MALHVYRRQPLIQDICRTIGYQGRYVWLVRKRTFRMRGVTYDADNNITWRMLPTPTDELLDVQQKEDRLFKLTAESVVTALPVIRGRRRKLFVFIHPLARARYWSQAPEPRLMPEERTVLLGHSTPYSSDAIKVARIVCELRNLITPAGNLTAWGAHALKKVTTTSPRKEAQVVR